MASDYFFKDVDRRAAGLRLVLLSASFFGLISTAGLWLNVRSFPLLPIVSGFPILPGPWDNWLLGGMLLSLLAAVFYYRVAVMVFLAASFFAFCEDQNRGQPWMYMYWVMLWLTLLPGAGAVAACRYAICAVYIWSGVEKCNAHFFRFEPGWFVSPAERWHLPAVVMSGLRAAVTCTPFIEIGIGVALWSRRLRPFAVGAVTLLHAGALLFLGPLGMGWNWVVWPWNLAMIGLVRALFAGGKIWAQPVAKGFGEKSDSRREEISLGQSFATLRRSKAGLTAVALFALLPALSFLGWWDSYFGFALYSENTANVNVFVTADLAGRLPSEAKAQVKPFAANYDPEHQGPSVLNIAAWCFSELHVPLIPEPRAYYRVFQALQQYAKEPEDLRMIVGRRDGKVVFYEGNSRQYLPTR